MDDSIVHGVPGAEPAMQRLCNGRVSVRLSVCPISIDSSNGGRWVCCRRRLSASNAGSVMLRADGGGSTQTCCFGLHTVG